MISYLIVVHDMFRYDDLSCHGGCIDTPALDRFASQNMDYKKYYSDRPFTSGAYSSMLGQLSPHNNGQNIKERRASIIEHTLQEGYKFVILWPEKFRTRDATSFMKKADIKLVYAAAKDYLRELKILNDMPEQIIVWCHLPHYYDRYELVSSPHPARIAHTKQETDAFWMECEKMGMDERIVRVFTADHGCVYGKGGRWYYGYNLYEDCTHIPLIVTGAKEVAREHQLHAQFQLWDLIHGQATPLKSLLITNCGKTHFNFEYAYIEKNLKYIYSEKPYNLSWWIMHGLRGILGCKTLFRRKEGLFDLELNSGEDFNLLLHEIKRKIERPRSRYPVRTKTMKRSDWDQIDAFLERARSKWQLFYKDESFPKCSLM